MKIGEFIIGRAALSDMHAVQTVIQRAYRGKAAAASWSHQGELPTGERISLDLLAGLIEDAASIFSLVKLGERIIGTSLVEPAAAGACKIGLLCVDPDLQGRGVGDYLLRNAEADAAERLGARRSFVEVLDQKPMLIRYYQRRGYTRTGSGRPYPHRLAEPAELLMLAKRLSRG